MLRPDQARIHSFKVIPSLPEPLKPLLEIANNLWWTWTDEAVELFYRIDPPAWTETGHNPIKLLGSCSQARLEELSTDETYLKALTTVYERLQSHLIDDLWYQKSHADEKDTCIAYFCAEFGLTECFQNYSGGLGVLAGDHLKAASELGVPLVGIGLLYRNGYFQQYLNADGWQQETYPVIDFANVPVRRMRGADGEQLKVSVQMPGRDVHCAVWQVTVGRVKLLLLDTNLDENKAEDRGITSQLYGGDKDMRIRQEIVLGIGGMRALKAAGLTPSVLHMNEGHAAFLALEHVRNLIAEHGVTFDEARQSAAGSHVFTTHTPVPAGIDYFAPGLVEHYFKDYVKGLKLDLEGLLALGRQNVHDKHSEFSMAVLALHTSDAAQGVSKLHGKVSREMWSGIWPGVPDEEIPIGRVTNGVHLGTWISSDLAWLYDRYLPMRWRTSPEDDSIWESLDHVPHHELWRIHERRRGKLVSWLRRTHRDQLRRRGASTEDMLAANELFDGSHFTIGFARRFATYKRAKLLFRDRDRLLSILRNDNKPVQIVLAGKAHPADTQGKELIRDIVHFARDNGVQNRVVFVENYNLAIARYMVQGCDLWMNTPRRGLEASGTSGMKAAINGVLNCSVLDGWWDEAWQQDSGWAIGGRDEHYVSEEYQDQVESDALYDLLEKQIVPMFYDRDASGLPIRWVQFMKNNMKLNTPYFNTHRMVQEYTNNYYMPAHKRGRMVMGDKLANGIEQAHYVQHLRRSWNTVQIEKIESTVVNTVDVHEEVRVTATVKLGDMSPEMLAVQIYCGPLHPEGYIQHGGVSTMQHAEGLGDGRHRFVGTIRPHASGRHGFSVRVVPGHEGLASPYIPGLITWDHESKKPHAASKGATVGAS